MKNKLSGAQLALLKERKGQFIENYKPGRKLMELELINAVPTQGGSYFKWSINEAGEAALSAILSS